MYSTVTTEHEFLQINKNNFMSVQLLKTVFVQRMPSYATMVTSKIIMPLLQVSFLKVKQLKHIQF